MTAWSAACSGGSDSSPRTKPPPATDVVTGQVVDAFVAGASVSAYQVNADGTQGTLIAGPVVTDSNGNYSLNLGSYTGPVFLASTGGTYVDTVSGKTIDLSGSSLILSVIVPSASGKITAQVTPMAAQLVPKLIAGTAGTSMTAAATCRRSRRTLRVLARP